ncbi:short chain dehydrogenase/ reductase-like protein [Calycina marina]|uniref:Short chain dehydrogenase/ reductase-like protein n=1 Tax=Calycina marina TaxID=1763456 RepID=A0A9P7ZAU7_9HELO|nr:short chain dehydrogenase/ reductase-like protein [Calycina marina]
MAAASKFFSIVGVVGAGTGSQRITSIAKEINSPGGSAIGISTDFQGKKPSAVVFKIGGSSIRKPFLELSLEESEGGYAANGTLPLILDDVTPAPHPPSLLITGATASLRGSSNRFSFASGKFALRATGQSLAREFGPKGVLVEHVVIDGSFDIPRTPDWPINGGSEDGKINSDATRSHFTQELDVRLYVEKF